MNDDSRILVSKELEGQIPDIEKSLYDYLFSAVCLYLRDSSSSVELEGPVQSFSISENVVNIEIKMNLDKAFQIMKSKDTLTFDNVNFVLKESLIKIDGLYKFEKIKLSDIDIDKQECNLEMIIKNVA